MDVVIPDEKTVTLLPADCPSEGVAVTEEVVNASVTIRNMVEDFDGIDNIKDGIPLHNVARRTLLNVVAYVKAAHRDPLPPPIAGLQRPSLMDWEREFFARPVDEIYDLMQAANYLDIPLLLDATKVALADRIKGRTPQELRMILGITNDFTPEEEKQLQLSNSWSGDLPERPTI